MKNLSKLAAVLAGTVIAAPAFAGNTFSGSLTFVTDYAFRGVSQTAEEAAIQGTLEANLGNGIYMGLFGSNVSALSYNNGNLEVDLYAGWRGEMEAGLILDIGALAYIYPNAETATSDYDTTEVYVGVSKDWFSAKYWYAVTDFFSLDTSDGSAYLEANANFTVAENLGLALHVGKQAVEGYDDLDYSDARIALNWTALPEENLVLGLTYTTTNADEDLYYVDDNGSNLRIAEDRWVISISRSF